METTNIIKTEKLINGKVQTVEIDVTPIKKVITLNDLVDNQVSYGSNSMYDNYNSKKQFLENATVTKNVVDLVINLKNCFSFAVLKTKRYMVITMWYNNTKKYTYHVIDLTTLAVETFDTIAQAKLYISTKIIVKA